MEEKLRTCILCGRQEEMGSYICAVCQEKIQSEVMGRRKKMREEAERAMRKYGITPEDSE